MFSCLHDLRRWGPKDRVTDEDARLLFDIAESDPTEKVRIELELVFDRNEDKATEACAATTASIVDLGGKVLHQARHKQIAYDALLIEVLCSSGAIYCGQKSCRIGGVTRCILDQGAK